MTQIEVIPSEPIRVQLRFGDKVFATDAANVLGVSIETINAMIRRGTLTKYALAGRNYVLWGDVERVLKEGEESGRGVYERKPKVWSYKKTAA